MKIFNFDINAKKKQIELNALEEQLSASLEPVVPRQQFVGDLRSRLMAQAAMTSTPDLYIREEKPVIQRGWVLAGGIFGSLVMIAVSIRGFISMVEKMGALLQKLVANKRTPASQPAH